jgi:hypothetical protein
MSIQPKLNYSSSSRFLELANRYSEVLTRQNILLKTTSDQSTTPIFDALPEVEKNEVLERMEDDVNLFAEAEREGDLLRDSPRLVWRYMQKKHIVPCNDIFDKIEKEDVVSIYDLRNRQIFQNMRFLELVSVTLEQLFCSPWYAYSKRDPEIEQSLYETAISIMSGQVRHTIAPPAPEHEAYEVNTEGLVKLSIKVKWVSPVFSSGNVAAMLVINRCRRIP